MVVIPSAARDLREAMLRADARRKNLVVACSALKQSYRELLRVNSEVRFVYPKGSCELLRERLRSRQGHHAGEQLLASQLADLEEPADAIVVDVACSPEKILAKICKLLALT